MFDRSLHFFKKNIPLAAMPGSWKKKFMPSREDDRITETVKNAAQLFHIRLLDHLIITYDTYYSYNDEGKL